MVKIKPRGIMWRSNDRWLAFLVCTVCLFLITRSVSAQLRCHYCDGCDAHDPSQEENCPTECAIWYSTNGVTVTVTRGCVEYASGDVTIYQRCDTELCNTASTTRCLRCASVFSTDCNDVICPTQDDQCYLNPTNGHRGCESDVEYSTDCPPEDDACSRCTPTANGRACNENLHCVVCDTSANPGCHLEVSFIQQCPSATDECYRYMDGIQALHFGCTSGNDFLTSCKPPYNCRTCATDECNRDGKITHGQILRAIDKLASPLSDIFTCYACSDCREVDEALKSVFECTVFEFDQCYAGYDWAEKQTYRGCAYEDLPPFDLISTCDESDCNSEIFPNHLQCYQCVGCSRISPEDINYCRDPTATACFMMQLESEGGGKTLVRGCNTDESFQDCQLGRNCVTCEGTQCNGEAGTEQRVCARCNNVNECNQQTVPSGCFDTYFTNQCFVYSDGVDELLKGCLLELDPEMAEACYDPSDTRCTICKDFNCNERHCASCSTRDGDGLACLLADNEHPLPYVLCTIGCRMEVDAEGHTVRGCIENFPNACDTVTGICNESLQPGSNVGIFPPVRRKCFQCDGVDSCQEEQHDMNGQYCRLYYGSNDGCYIFNDGFDIIRGCTSDPSAKCSESGSQDPNCKIFTGDLSNGAAVVQMSCYRDCPGAGSEMIPSCPPVYCGGSDDRCFLSVSGGGVISRGCTSMLNGCPADSKDCYICNEPNCNGAHAICATCDSSIETDCLVAEDHQDVCDGMAGCFQYQDIDREIFGCAEQAPADCAEDADHCRFCDEAMCNAKALTLCFSCTNCPSVAEPTVQPTRLCPTEQDRCITGIIDSRIDRGCSSELPSPIEDYIVIEDCVEAICNNLAASEWASCYVCIDCPDVPNAQASSLCVSPPTNQCFTRRDSEGLIHRGCATEVNLEGCTDGLNCAVCQGEHCNGEPIFGASPESPPFGCVRCEAVENCADYNTVSVCPNELGLLFDGCVTYDDGTSVQKGCLSDSNMLVLCGAGANPDHCQVSSMPMGNARPIRCLKCQEDAACVLGDPAELEAPTYEQGSCVAFINEGGWIERGNSIENPACKESSHCVECYSDACNVGLIPEDRLQCYQCSGTECASAFPAGVPTFTSQPCLRYNAPTDRCYTLYEDETIARRGCLQDEAICEGADDGGCQLCASNGCNDVDYAHFIQTTVCILCSTNRECETAPTEQMCSGSGGCFTFFSGSFVVAKGCVSEIGESAPWYEDCMDGGSSDRCLRCYGDRCNRNRCYVCNSSLAGMDGCINPLTDGAKSAVCPGSDECVAFIDDEGHTVRGCADDHPEQVAKCSEPDEKCQSCRGDLCNAKPLPEDRIKCYQCSGSDTTCITPVKGSESYCGTYREGKESCFTHFIDTTTVERGCTLQRDSPCQGYCQECSTSGCNDQLALAQNPLHCVHCSGESCVGIDAPNETNAIQCPGELLFGRTDRCYTHFDEEGIVLQRGCLSELTLAGNVVASQCEDPLDVTCKLCSKDGCNARSVQCFVCDSDTTPGCSDVLNGDVHHPLQRRCGTDQCVSLLNGETTRRGCAEDFEGTSCDQAHGCETFIGPLSNGGMYPADRLRCHQCTGLTCGRVLETATPVACQQYRSEDECYTYVSDTGETSRGCLSDPEGADTCLQNPYNCIRCTSHNGCNVEPSESPNELTCAQCNGAAGCSQGDGSSPVQFERCRRPLLLGRQDSCYTQSFAGEVLARGCLSDVDASLSGKCTNGLEDECTVCQCDRCNGPPIECVSCAGETFGCGDVLGNSADLSKCRTGTCVSFVRQFTNGSSIIVKGCSEAYEKDTCTAMAQPDVGSYQLCHDSGCNDVRFPLERLKCYQCTGESCSDPSLEPTLCEPYYGPTNDQCYSFTDRQQKGCLGELENPEICTPDGSGGCRVCASGDGCNEEPRALQCIDCSSKNDSRCVDPMLVGKSTKWCPIGGCVTLIDDEGFTVKGCAEDHDLNATFCSTTGASCHVCSDGDRCNDVLFPNDRLHCFQCSGAGCLDVSQLRPITCQRYDPTDVCYSYATDPMSIERGCLSDRVSPCPDECVTCTGTSSNGCNDDPPLVPNSLTCHRCEGAFCASAQIGAGTECPAVLLGHTDACYSFVETYTVRRGCLSEVDVCNPADPNCHICYNGKDCNGAAYPVTTRECIHCSEDEDGESCRWGFARSNALQCPESGSSSFGAGCYTCYVEDRSSPELTPNGTALAYQRGCVGDDRQSLCRQDTLSVCLGAGCNHRNERLQICAKCETGCDGGRWLVEECRGAVEYERRGCFLMRDGRKRVLARGCVADLKQDDWQRCSNARDASCVTCLENECNRAVSSLRGVSLLGLVLVALLAVAGARR
ncbi:LOW QUALITY PROTEIN: uncharacterized protein LOC128722834 [Anopheles nili]|uniref:LOW QUALITY PROTEIN: uncharacterized protein LOC128722834 n=1 Tax=Anopheles nili TaxID=185578 RepID=UPI00237A759A|nr:LOW QUALITY PROTEIN: uncharacterized protein LOC128722834 [Anopheles nili]